DGRVDDALGVVSGHGGTSRSGDGFVAKSKSLGAPLGKTLRNRLGARELLTILRPPALPRRRPRSQCGNRTRSGPPIRPSRCAAGGCVPLRLRCPVRRVGAPARPRRAGGGRSVWRSVLRL